MCLRQHFAKLIKITVRFLYRVGMQIDKIVLEVGGLTKCARFDSLGGSFWVLCSAGWRASPDLAAVSPRRWQQLPRAFWTALCMAGRSTSSSLSNATPAATLTLRLLSCAPRRSSTTARSPPALQTQRCPRPPCSDASLQRRENRQRASGASSHSAVPARAGSGCLGVHCCQQHR